MKIFIQLNCKECILTKVFSVQLPWKRDPLLACGGVILIQ